jgi:hypothetical protein
MMDERTDEELANNHGEIGHEESGLWLCGEVGWVFDMHYVEIL